MQSKHHENVSTNQNVAGGHLVARHHGAGAGEGGTPARGPAPHEGPLPHPQEQPADAGGPLQQGIQAVRRSLPQQGPQPREFLFLVVFYVFFKRLKDY